MDAVDSSHGRILYIAAGNGVHKSTDYGTTWKIMTDWQITEVLDVKVDQQHPQNVDAATAWGLWHSDDGGETWQPTQNQELDRYCYRFETLDDTPVVLHDSGITSNGWPPGEALPAEHIPASYPRSILELPSIGLLVAESHPSRLTLVRRKNSYQAGASKRDSITPAESITTLLGKAPNMHIYDMRLYPSSPGDTTMSLYLAGDAGIWKSKIPTDTTWQNITSNMPDTVVHSLVYLPMQRQLLAGTFGSGVFRHQEDSWIPLGPKGAMIWRLVIKQF
jgi:hypothetical protein